MNYYFVRQCFYIIVVLIVGKFKIFNCYNLTDIVTEIENIVNSDDGKILLKNSNSNITFIPDENGRIDQCKYAVAWKGVLIEENANDDDDDDQNPIIIKFLIDETEFLKECRILNKLKANDNENVEDNGIPSVRFYKNVLNKYFALAITSYDETFEEIIENNGKLSAANLLRLFYHAIVALEYVHSCDIIGRNIEPNNFVYDYINGKVYLFDFHLSAAKKDQNVVTGENRIYCPINRHLGKIELFYDDMKSLYYVMLHYASFKLIWESNVDSSNDRQLAKAKNQFDKMKVLTGPSAVRNVFKQYHDDIMVQSKKRCSVSIRPNYADIKKYISDGIKKATSTRSLKFEWDRDEETSENELLSNENQPIRIPILYNSGTALNKKGTTYLTLRGTCGFDAIFHLFLAFYADIDKLKNVIDQSEKPFDQLIVMAFTKDIIETIDERTKLLYKMFPEKFLRTGSMSKHMDCGLIKSEFVLAASHHSNVVFSAKVYGVCERCNIKILEKTHVFMPLSWKHRGRSVALDLQTYIDRINWKTNSICNRCREKMNLKIKFNSIVLIDTYRQGHRSSIKRDEITRIIILNGKIYEFRGAVGHLQYRFDAHAVAHIKRNNNHWETYDDNKNSTLYTPSKFTSHMYVYALTN